MKTKKATFIVSCVFLALTVVLAVVSSIFTYQAIHIEDEQAIALLAILPFLFIMYALYLAFDITSIILSGISTKSEHRGIKIASIVITCVNSASFLYLIFLFVRLITARA